MEDATFSFISVDFATKQGTGLEGRDRKGIPGPLLLSENLERCRLWARPPVDTLRKLRDGHKTTTVMVNLD